eukprot:3695051-Rhodomonas_salina.2
MVGVGCASGGRTSGNGPSNTALHPCKIDFERGPCLASGESRQGCQLRPSHTPRQHPNRSSIADRARAVRSKAAFCAPRSRAWG